ncbi:peptidoglycan-binding protein LysM [Spirochaetia bacterium]|nr:peptidoglycan-binding protein LysM [Spirochaetia bacterium]
MILSLVYFISSLGVFSLPMSLPLGGKNEDAVENGIGGMDYVEASLVRQESDSIFADDDSQDLGIPEPESFSKPRMLLSGSYRVQKGDMIGSLARDFGLNEDTLLSLNTIKNARTLQIGQALKIPNQDGILYTVKQNDTLSQIAEKYSADPEAIQTVNELFSDTVHAGTVLFVPGAKLDWVERQEINGDLFLWPVSSRRITSSYGRRRSPISGAMHFHSGIDVGAPTGTPIRSAMPGRVTTVGWDDAYGNFVVVSHHSGYRTLYAHMSVIRVKYGAYVGAGERIGDVGSTGQSTGPHLHFTVYKNGVTVSPLSLMK